MLYTVQSGSYRGTVHVPPSKSDSQRALLCAALASGTSVVKNSGVSNDETAMRGAIEGLNATVTAVNNETLHIEGSSSFPSQAGLFVGESGLATRLLTGVLACNEGKYEIRGSGTLLKRPMGVYTELFPTIGVHFSSTDGYLPFTVEGPITSHQFSVDGSQSSQYISGLLMGLPLLKHDTLLHVQHLASRPYLAMTLATLAQFGIEIQHTGFEFFTIKGQQRYQACTYLVEGDWSSASYWLVAAALGSDVTISGLSMASLQADKQLLNALLHANCSVSHHEEGIRVKGEDRKAFEFDSTHCPDLFPALAVLAAFTDGTSCIHGVHRLATKESDRASVLQQELTKLGVEVTFREDSMLIKGKRQLNGATIDAHNDHRIAMCFGIAGILTQTPILIEGAEAVEKSYPTFWQQLSRLKS